MSIHESADQIAEYIARELELDHIRQGRISFGAELLLGELVKLGCLISLAILLGIFPEVFTISVAAALLRLASGGEHCSEYYRCLIGGTACFLLLGWLVQKLNPLLNTNVLLIAVILGFLLAEALLWRYAPGDTENKRITEPQQRRKFKKLSMLMVLGYLILMLFSLGIASLHFLALPILAGMLEQTFTVSPWGYRFIHLVDSALAIRK